MENFYELKFGMKKDEIFIEAIKDYNDQFLKTGKYIPKETFSMQYIEGSIWYDIVRFQDPFNLAISERVEQSLMDCGLLDGALLKLK